MKHYTVVDVSVIGSLLVEIELGDQYSNGGGSAPTAMGRFFWAYGYDRILYEWLTNSKSSTYSPPQLTYPYRLLIYRTKGGLRAS